MYVFIKHPSMTFMFKSKLGIYLNAEQQELFQTIVFTTKIQQFLTYYIFISMGTLAGMCYSPPFGIIRGKKETKPVWHRISATNESNNCSYYINGRNLTDYFYTKTAVGYHLLSASRGISIKVNVPPFPCQCLIGECCWYSNDS